MNFKMKSVTVVTVGLVTILLQSFAGAQTPMHTPPGFSDVPENHWAYLSVRQMAQAGLMEGDPQDRFRGTEAMTRYEFSVAMSRLISGYTPPPMVTINDLKQILNRLTAIENRLSELEKKVAVAPASLKVDDVTALNTEVKTAVVETSVLVKRVAD